MSFALISTEPPGTAVAINVTYVSQESFTNLTKFMFRVFISVAIRIIINMLHTVRFELHVKLGIYSAVISNNPNSEALSFSPLMLYTRAGEPF